MGGFPWTEQDDKLIRENARLGSRRIAGLTGRTSQAVLARAMCLGVKLGARSPLNFVGNPSVFLEAVEPEMNTGCWLWSKGLSSKGYGVVKAHGFMLAHRLSYMLFNGDFDRTLWVLHKCDTPACVNPGHLFLGDAQDNSDDKMSKGRGRSSPGAKNPRSKLTDGDVASIRLCSEPTRMLAARYGVSKSAIERVRNGSSWICA